MTHVDKMNAKNNNMLKKSPWKMLQSKEGQYFKFVSLLSLAPITSYTKPGGNMMGITGPLVGCVRRKIEDKYERWCGFVLLSKDNRETLVLTA